jgi:hypothetical protein
LAGFSSISDKLKDEMVNLPQHYTQFDVKLGWEIKAGTNSTTVEGIIQNIRYARMENIEIWVSALDGSGKQIGRATSYVIPLQLDMNDLTSFSLKLPVATTAGTKLVFTYKYVASDGGSDDGGGINWMQSFEAVVPPPVAAR